MSTLGKAAEGFIGALSELEEICPCPCGNMFLCRHKTCPQCGAVNPKYKEFTDEDQRRGQIKVDAALDKHNSEKLAHLIRSYSDRAQYIVISHNDAIISESSRLYGVSMDEFGMSTVTTLEL